MISKESPAPSSFQIVENEHLLVRFDPKRLWFDVQEKKSGQWWHHDPWTDSVGEVTVTHRLIGTRHICSLSDAKTKSLTPLPDKNGFKLHFTDLVDNSASNFLVDLVSLTASVYLEEDQPELCIEITGWENITQEWVLQEIAFPVRFGWFKALAEAFLLVPWNCGLIFPGQGRQMRRYDSHFKWMDIRFSLDYYGYNIPMFASVVEGSGMMAILDTPYDCNMEVMNCFNPGGTEMDSTLPRISACWPNWRPSKGDLGYTRKMRYRFLHQTDYVALAKAYRQDAIARGKFHSLEEKAAQLPNLRKLYGAPCYVFINGNNYKCDPDKSPNLWGTLYDGYENIESSFEDVQQCVRTLKDELGVEKAQIVSYGANEGGMDMRYPDIFPINEKAGGEAQLKALADLVVESGFVGPMGDTFIHAYLDSPSFDPGNMVLDGGRVRRYPHRGNMGENFDQRMQFKNWNGGTEYTHCGPAMMKFARRNYPALMETAPFNGTYLDVITRLPLNECYDPDHPMRREDDARNRNELLAYIRSLGIVVDSEMAMEYALANLDTTHLVVPPPVGLPIPFWQLVYHDAIIVKQFVGPNWIDFGDPDPKNYLTAFLRTLVNGDSVMLFPTVDLLKDEHYREWIRTLSSVIQQYHGAMADKELISHQFLTEDFGVQKSEFAGGTTAIVNFRMIGYETPEGEPVKPQGYLITLPEGDIIRGSFWPL